MASQQKTRFVILLLAGLFAFVFFLSSTPTASALTTVPTKLNFQGRLTDSTGTIKPNGTYNMRFKLYTVATAGTSVWSEDRLVSAANGVTLTNGLFSVQLGSITSLPASLFASGALYLEVELPTPATATTTSPTWTEGPMTPRNQMATSAYAYNSETLDGLDSAAFGQIGAANIWTGDNTFNGSSLVVDAVSSIDLTSSTQININAPDVRIAGPLSVTGAISGSDTISGVRLISTTATGTAPITVSSTTKVTSLNADLLDGLDSTAFGDATAANQTTILNRIGTNADAAGTTTVFARLASIDTSKIGATGDAASATGSLFARLKYLTTSIGATTDTASSTGSVNAKLAYLISNGAKGVDVQTFDTSGTWTKPTGAKRVEVQVWSGGGGGARVVFGQNQVAGGGGGGGYASGVLNASDLAATVTVTVGAGGAGAPINANYGGGSDGGPSSFGTHIKVQYGGQRGDTNMSGGFSGGGGGIGDPTSRRSTTINNTALTGEYDGGTGGYGQGSYAGGWSRFGGGGGGTAWGSSDTAGAGGASSSGGNGGNGGRSAAPTAGAVPGGGGGASGNSATYAGGNGGSGRVIVITYF